MFWDGQRWIPDGSTSNRRPRDPRQPRRLRDWLATIPLILLVPALVAPIVATEAAKPTPAPGAVLALRGSVAPGSSVKLTGTGFTPAATAAITWDASTLLDKVKTNQRGSFTTNATIPKQAQAGKHLIAVSYEPVATGAPAAATLEVAVDPAAPDPTAAPPTPKPDPTTPPPDPTAAPTARPDPTPNPTSAPTAAPDPTPKPTPDPTPKPTPTPPPPTSTRPFAAPVTTDTYRVPSSIDASGGSDASAELISFIKSVPNGSVISFPGSGVYRIDKGLLLAGRTNLVLDGNGATLKMRGAGSDEAASAFLLRGSSHIAIRQFTVVGNNPNTSTIFVPGNEQGHVLSLSGWYGGGPSSYVEMSNVAGSHVYGDGAYLEGENVGTHRPSHDIWIHDNSFSYVGRNGVSSINVTDVLVEDNRFDKIGYHVWDIEPNLAAERVVRNTFRQNSVGSYSHIAHLLGFFVASWNPTGLSRIDSITVAGNTVSGTASASYDGSPRGLNLKFVVGNTSDVVVKNNSSTRAAIGPVLYFSKVSGVTVTNNTQPLVSGSLARFDNCTNVSYP
jgi:hypothetical protein